MSLDAVPIVVTEKTRWLRTFDTSTAAAREIVRDARGTSGDPSPVRGCHAELIRAMIAQTGVLWWTFGLEAFGSGR